jgi:hypothetical protein
VLACCADNTACVLRTQIISISQLQAGRTATGVNPVKSPEETDLGFEQISTMDDSSSSQTVTPSVPRGLRHILKGRSGKQGGKSFMGLKPIRVRLISGEVINTSTAGAANTINSNVTFTSSTFSEIADFALLYDECRVLYVKVHYRPFITTTGTGAQSAACAFAIGFDPSVSSAGSPAGVLQETHSVGPFRLFPGVNGNNLQSSIMLEKYLTISAKTPPPLAPITSSDVPGSAWFAVDGSTAPIIFQWYGLVNAIGTGGITNVAAFYELDVEFRLRT